MWTQTWGPLRRMQNYPEKPGVGGKGEMFFKDTNLCTARISPRDLMHSKMNIDNDIAL